MTSPDAVSSSRALVMAAFFRPGRRPGRQAVGARWRAPRARSARAACGPMQPPSCCPAPRPSRRAFRRQEVLQALQRERLVVRGEQVQDGGPVSHAWGRARASSRLGAGSCATFQCYGSSCTHTTVCTHGCMDTDVRARTLWRTACARRKLNGAVRAGRLRRWLGERQNTRLQNTRLHSGSSAAHDHGFIIVVINGSALPTCSGPPLHSHSQQKHRIKMGKRGKVSKNQGTPEEKKNKKKMCARVSKVCVQWFSARAPRWGRRRRCWRCPPSWRRG